jgi:hypothetical protein
MTDEIDLERCQEARRADDRDLRARLIAEGIIVPALPNGEPPSFARAIDALPVLRMDDVGRHVAARDLRGG